MYYRNANSLQKNTPLVKFTRNYKCDPSWAYFPYPTSEDTNDVISYLHGYLYKQWVKMSSDRVEST